MIHPKAPEDLFSRAVSAFIDPAGSFVKKLAQNPKDIRIKLGVDPTRPDIHLGHSVLLRKLRQFQDLGCKVIFLIGDYTAQIGDPSGKNIVRPEVSQQEIELNMKTYLDQVGKILRTDDQVFSWIRNSDWYSGITDFSYGADMKPAVEIENREIGTHQRVPLDPNSFVGKALLFENSRMQKTHLHKEAVVSVTLRTLLWTLRHITHTKLIARDMFEERLQGGNELYMHEMLYPVLQGIDSFVLSQIYGSCDLEIGGSDQTFNMLIGRDVMKVNGVREQSVMVLKLLEGTDGTEKMSKSLDNYISIVNNPRDVYGKVMSIPDSSLVSYYTLATYTPLPEVQAIEADLEKGSVNPRDVKARLAHIITAMYHGEEAAERAGEQFVEAFRKGRFPADAPRVPLPRAMTITDALVASGVAKSKTEARRLIEDGAVTIPENGKKFLDPNEKIEETVSVRIGATRFVCFEISK